MPDANKTLITVVLDRSGSMETIRRDMEGALNTFVREQKEVPGKCKFTLVQFDTTIDTVYSRINLPLVERISLVPRGGTALLDAMGVAFTSSRDYVSGLAKARRPLRNVVVVVTDGEENSSHEWTRPRIFDLVLNLREEGWQFIFLGANQDAIAVGRSYGFAASSSMSYAPTTRGVVSSTYTTSSAVSQYRLGATPDVAFAAAARAAAMDEDDD